MNRILFIAGVSAATVGVPVATAGLLAGALTGSWPACWAGLGMVIGGGAAWLIGAAGTAAAVRHELGAVTARLPETADVNW
ncbi:MAG TPA: hypothetical protein VGF55_05510 [Gemmataceae bacterium]|jgi:hypothetical protein